ncbi:hypothetical protein K2X33_11320 [bacterium]|nr:hypothetical protein [bacterium]
MDKNTLSLAQNYQPLVHAAFESRFQDFGSMGQTDPVRLFADALCLSLASVEDRQNRLIDTLLDCLPTLVGFDPLPARLPTGLFAITPSAKLREPQAFQAGEVFRFRSEERVYLARLEKSLLLQAGAATEAVLSLCEQESELELGQLQGLPWESLALPEGLVEIPQELVLRLPSENTVTLSRASDSVLRLREANPELFRQSFFYNPSRHEVVIPAADRCMGDFRGGVRVCVANALVRPSHDWPTAMVYVSEHPKHISAIRAVRPLTSYVAREQATAYLGRFQATVRRLPARAGGFFPEDICRQIPGVEERVRLAEYTRAGNVTTFYLYFGTETALSTEDRDDAVAQVQSFLSNAIPLEHAFEVKPFDEVPVRLLVAENSTARASACGEPYPFGACRIGEVFPKASVVAELLENGAPAEMIVGASGALSDGLLRLPGQRFAVRVGPSTGGAHV